MCWLKAFMFMDLKCRFCSKASWCCSTLSCRHLSEAHWHLNMDGRSLDLLVFFFCSAQLSLSPTSPTGRTWLGTNCLLYGHTNNFPFPLDCIPQTSCLRKVNWLMSSMWTVIVCWAILLLLLWCLCLPHSLLSWSFSLEPTCHPASHAPCYLGPPVIALSLLGVSYPKLVITIAMNTDVS